MFLRFSFPLPLSLSAISDLRSCYQRPEVSYICVCWRICLMFSFVSWEWVNVSVVEAEGQKKYIFFNLKKNYLVHLGADEMNC